MTDDKVEKTFREGFLVKYFQRDSSDSLVFVLDEKKEFLERPRCFEKFLLTDTLINLEKKETNTFVPSNMEIFPSTFNIQSTSSVSEELFIFTPRIK